MEERKEITEQIATLIGDKLGSGWGYSFTQLKCAEEIYDKFIEPTAHKFVKEIAETLSNYLYENVNGGGVNGENVIMVAPYIEINNKIIEIAKKYGVEDKD